MNDPEPPPKQLGITSTKAYRALRRDLFTRLCDLFDDDDVDVPLNVIDYMSRRDRAIREGAWLLVYDNAEHIGITTIPEATKRLSDIWPQSKS
jgi:hypothetical protein